MSILSDVKMYWRFAGGLPSFLHHTISLDKAREIVSRRMAEREKNFLRLVERGIFGYPRSPYLPLLKLAQVEFADIRDMVRSKGLEETLRELKEAGVYISFEEFKGREPIVRNGQTIPVRDRDFDNPFLGRYYYAETGGTTGVGTRVGIDLDHLAADTPFIVLAHDAYGVLDAPSAIWRPVLPDSSGLNYVLRGACLGNVPQKWFSPITSQDSRPALKYRLATQYIVQMGRLAGVSLPRPEPVSLQQAGVVARWIAETVKAEGACVVFTIVSLALRVCIAAREDGLDLTGATFLVGGEPPTPAKVQAIVNSGARCIPHYHFKETGRIGMGCCRPVDCNDVHFFKDGLAVIQRPRPVPGFGIMVDAFCFTTLLPTAPKLMLNVESDDYGVIETRSCGCPLESYGYADHLRDIRSFRKLTGEGVTLVGDEMVRILEHVLPARFGGSALDYQLVEEEDEKGFTRVSLLVSPKIEIPDDTTVISVLMEALRRSSVAAGLAGTIWSQANTLRVKRMEPIWTARGKLMPLHLARRSKGPGGAST
jgi:hypothetical protein